MQADRRELRRVRAVSDDVCVEFPTAPRTRTSRCAPSTASQDAPPTWPYSMGMNAGAADTRKLTTLATLGRTRATRTCAILTATEVMCVTVREMLHNDNMIDASAGIDL